MHDALVGLLDKVDTAVAESAGVLERSALEAVAELARNIRLRLSYPESVIVAALAGGTGSGKSSVLNAVAGEEVAFTGGMRPVTSKPLALVPQGAAAALSGYLDAIGIQDRVAHDGPPWLCLIDLPDTDSVEVEHRHQVDALLPRIDVVVWVTDPEKYNDASWHHGYLTRLLPYQGQFLFVLNQVDRIDPEDSREIEADLVEALLDDGIAKPRLVVTAADPVAGPPLGVDRLLAALGDVRAAREAAHGKSMADLTVAASSLVKSASGAHGVDFESRWAAEVEAAARLAVAGHAAGGAHDLAAFIASLGQEVEGEISDRLQALAVEVHASFLACVTEAGGREGRPGARQGRRLFRRRRSHLVGAAQEEAGVEAIVRLVDERIGGPIRELLMRRGQAHAAITELALALGEEGRRVTREGPG